MAFPRSTVDVPSIYCFQDKLRFTFMLAWRMNFWYHGDDSLGEGVFGLN